MTFLLLFFIGLSCAATIQWKKFPNPGNTTWTNFRVNAASARVVKNGEAGIFFFGGTDKTEINCCRDSYFYFPNRTNDKFVPAASNTLVNSGGIYSHRMAAAGDSVYVHGGTLSSSSAAACSELFRYSIKDDKWELFDNTGPSLMSHSMVTSLDEKYIYIFGGKSSMNALTYPSDRLYIFDIANKNWTMYTTSWGKLWPTARDSHSSVVYQMADGSEAMAVIGGGSGSSSLTCPKDMFWTLNMKTSEWSYLPFPPDIYCYSDGGALPIISNSTMSRNGTFVFFEGASADGSGWNSNAYVYNDKTRMWTTYSNPIDGPNPMRMFSYGEVSLPISNMETGKDIFRIHLIAGCQAQSLFWTYCEAIDDVWEMSLDL